VVCVAASWFVFLFVCVCWGGVFLFFFIFSTVELEFSSEMQDAAISLPSQLSIHPHLTSFCLFFLFLFKSYTPCF